MKQLLFLLLFPCLAMAQYQGNANQKITLGEQTTADGLIWRGVAASDTVRKPSIDTMAYMVLDTTTNIMWHYKKATSNAWLRLNLLPSDTASMLTNYLKSSTASTTYTPLTRSISTTAPLQGGGDLSANRTLSIVDASASVSGIVSTGTQTFAGVKTFSEFKVDNPGNTQLTINTNGNLNSVGAYFVLNRKNNTRWAFGLSPYNANNDFEINPKNAFVALTIKDSTGEFIFKTIPTNSGNGTERMRISSDGEVNIGYGATDNGAYKLQVNSQIFATNATIATSDIRFKENIQPLDKGLEIINKLKPVKFNFISTTENNFSEFDEIGFIAQDVEGALSTELFAKAVVKKLDEDKDDSALGLMTEKFIPILVKAMQEQQALIKALEQRIINLENK